MTNLFAKTWFRFVLAKMQIVCYTLIYAKLRQFQRKLAGGPGWIRIPSLAPSFYQPLTKAPLSFVPDLRIAVPAQ